jgi:hypothetical protein
VVGPYIYASAALGVKRPVMPRTARRHRRQGAAMEGTAQGSETVRSIVVTARTFYDDQVSSFAGDHGHNGFLEEYSCLIGLGAQHDWVPSAPPAPVLRRP